MTSAQLRVLEVLLDLAGWACAAALKRHGAQPAYAGQLTETGHIQHRTSIGANGLPFAEWRAVAQPGEATG